MAEPTHTTIDPPADYKDPWADVAMVEREIRLAAYTSAGDPARANDIKMFAIWSGRLQKAINDAAA